MRGFPNQPDSMGYAPVQSGRRKSWFEHARRVFGARERPIDYSIEKQPAPVFYTPTYAAESFVRSTTSREIKKHHIPQAEA